MSFEFELKNIVMSFTMLFLQDVLFRSTSYKFLDQLITQHSKLITLSLMPCHALTDRGKVSVFGFAFVGEGTAADDEDAIRELE